MVPQRTELLFEALDAEDPRKNPSQPGGCSSAQRLLWGSIICGIVMSGKSRLPGLDPSGSCSAAAHLLSWGMNPLNSEVDQDFKVSNLQKESRCLAFRSCAKLRFSELLRQLRLGRLKCSGSGPREEVWVPDISKAPLSLSLWEASPRT